MQGIFVSGECLGCKSEEKSFVSKITGNKEVFNDTKLGIRIPKADGFDGETEVIAIGLAKKHIDGGLPVLFAELKGKMISVPIYARAFTSGKGTFIEYKLSGDGKPLED